MFAMRFAVEVPDSFTKPLHLDGPQPERRVLEVLALHGYRSGELSRGQVSELLDLEFNETMGFLKKYDCARSISFEELEQEVQQFRERHPFRETEQFPHDHHSPGLTPEQNLEGVRNLERLLARKNT